MAHYNSSRSVEERLRLRPSQRLELAASQRYNCSSCHNRLGPIFHVDHIKALGNGGTNCMSNLTVLCPNCHAVKTNDDMQRFWDYNREQRTGKSRFWEPTAREYLFANKNPS